MGEALQRAFLHHGAAQCGICTPGIPVAATALLAATPSPEEAAAMAALGGVPCRGGARRGSVKLPRNLHQPGQATERTAPVKRRTGGEASAVTGS